jgi:hypothetical protein
MKIEIGAVTVEWTGDNQCTASAEVRVIADDAVTVLETTPFSRTVGAGDPDPIKSISDPLAAHAYERYRQQQMALELQKGAPEMQTEAQRKAEEAVALYDAAVAAEKGKV